MTWVVIANNWKSTNLFHALHDRTLLSYKNSIKATVLIYSTSLAPLSKVSWQCPRSVHNRSHSAQPFTSWNIIYYLLLKNCFKSHLNVNIQHLLKLCWLPRLTLQLQLVPLMPHFHYTVGLGHARYGLAALGLNRADSLHDALPLQFRNWGSNYSNAV